MSENGIIGLANLGNTCFLNSALQCLLNTPELNAFLETASYKARLTDTPDAAILSEYDELRRMIWSNSTGTMRPGKFVTTVHKVARHKDKDIFTGFAQNDLPEFLLFIIDCFNNAIKRSVTITVDGTPQNDKDKLAISCYTVMKRMYEKEYSEMLGIFFGIHTSIVNTTTSLLSTSPEPFFILSLPIPINNPHPTIYDCFDLYTSEEQLTGENQYVADEKTNEKVDATKRILFWNLPKVLIVDLKRFVVDGNRLRKYDGSVAFSPREKLDLSKYIVGYSPSQYKYELYGVCNHFGGLTGGHYTAYVKRQNGQWWHFNDAHVSPIREEDVCSASAYCLFYRQQSQ